MIAEQDGQSITGGRAFVLNRTRGSILPVDAKNGYAPGQEISTGAGSNPHDIIISGSSAYVSLYGSASIAVLDAATLSKKGSIDLSKHCAGTATIPFADRMYLDGTNLFVSAQRYTDNYYSGIGTSQILVIDTQTNTVSLYGVTVWLRKMD